MALLSRRVCDQLTIPYKALFPDMLRGARDRSAFWMESHHWKPNSVQSRTPLITCLGTDSFSLPSVVCQRFPAVFCYGQNSVNVRRVWTVKLVILQLITEKVLGTSWASTFWKFMTNQNHFSNWMWEILFDWDINSSWAGKATELKRYSSMNQKWKSNINLSTTSKISKGCHSIIENIFTGIL